MRDVTVTVYRGEASETQQYHNARVTQCASTDGRYWFVLTDESAFDRTIRELREENEILEGAIAELAEMIGGNE